MVLNEGDPRLSPFNTLFERALFLMIAGSGC